MDLINRAPIFLSSPCLVVGTPVLFANLCFAPVIPNNLFSENENPYLLIKLSVYYNDYYIIYTN